METLIEEARSYLPDEYTGELPCKVYLKTIYNDVYIVEFKRKEIVPDVLIWHFSCIYFDKPLNR